MQLAGQPVFPSKHVVGIIFSRAVVSLIKAPPCSRAFDILISDQVFKVGETIGRTERKKMSDLGQQGFEMREGGGESYFAPPSNIKT